MCSESIESITRPSTERNSSESYFSLFQSRLVTSNTLPRRLDIVSSGPKIRKFFDSSLSLKMSLTNPPSSIISCASTAPGLGTSIPYSLKSGSLKSFKSLPPLACGLEPILLSPVGARALSSGISLPFSSKSSSGW